MVLISTYTFLVSKTLISNLCNLRVKGFCAVQLMEEEFGSKFLHNLKEKSNSWLSLDLWT